MGGARVPYVAPMDAICASDLEGHLLLYGPMRARSASRGIVEPSDHLGGIDEGEIAEGMQVRWSHDGESLLGVITSLLPGVPGAPTNWAKVKITESGHRLEGRTTGWLPAVRAWMAPT